MLLKICAATTLAALSIVAVTLLAIAPRETGLQLAARYTARFAFFVFLPAYGASAVHALAPSSLSLWAVKNRRALGLAFAAAHGVHLGALVAYGTVSGQTPPVSSLVLGGGAYVFIFLMALTSNDRAVRWMGHTAWKRLHTAGVHWIWLVFTLSYAKRVAAGKYGYVPLLAVALGVAGLRLFARRATRPSAAS
jgi:methionine sulfoxide reductase heme-binding subunit